MPYIWAKFYLKNFVFFLGKKKKYKSNNDSVILLTSRQADQSRWKQNEFFMHTCKHFFSYRGLRLFHQVGLFLQPMKPVNISESQQKESRSQPFNGHLMVRCWIFYHVVNQIEDEIFSPVQKIRWGEVMRSILDLIWLEARIWKTADLHICMSCCGDISRWVHNQRTFCDIVLMWKYAGGKTWLKKPLYGFTKFQSSWSPWWMNPVKWVQHINVYFDHQAKAEKSFLLHMHCQFMATLN